MGFTNVFRDDPIAPVALRGAALGVALLASLALTAAGVRVLPWVLAQGVPLGVAMPFARAVASVALEAAVLVGWPIGAALAVFAVCERGEGRVLLLLGERPARTASRLAPAALIFGALLAGASLAGGRDASEPGRVLAELIAHGRASCASTSATRATNQVDVPLVGATWLCSGGEAGDAHLVGAPSVWSGARDARAIFTARGIAVSDDARSIALDDAWLALESGTRVHVAHASFRLPPFVRASSLAPWLRALLLATSGIASSLLAGWSVLVLASLRDSLWRLHAIALGAAGPLSALGVLRALERVDASRVFYIFLPAIAAGATLLVALVLGSLWRLPRFRPAAST